MAQPNTADQFTGSELSSGFFPAQPDVSLDEMAGVVPALKQVQGQSLQAALEAGEVIFRFVFKGDEQLLRARGRKCSSFRKLSSHPELRMSSSSLWRAVAIYELSLRFPELVEYVHTGVGHISVVLGLPATDQFRLLRQTETERWTRRKLQKVVTQLRIEQRDAGEVPKGKLIERLAGLSMLASDVSSDRRLDYLSDLETRQALELLGHIREQCAGLESQLFQSLSN
jgi:hypothetical protein